jgi:hypothetical protein
MSLDTVDWYLYRGVVTYEITDVNVFGVLERAVLFEDIHWAFEWSFER